MNPATSQAPGRRGRGCLLWLGGALLLILGLVLAGAVYESASEAADVRAYPPPGQLVDVGGYRLHIYCTGAGSPAVVIDAGWGDWSLGWSRVQPGVAAITRVCTYDRAGMGYSEAGPLPRDAGQFAAELHTLLGRAGIPGPYVLAGHSLGGLPVRVYAHEYPAEVAGIVLIDSMSPGQASRPDRSPDPGSGPTPTRLAQPVRSMSLLARIGLVRLVIGPGSGRGLAPDASQAYAAFSVTPRAVQAWADEGQGLPASLVEAGAVKSFGAVPLVVLSRGLDPDPEWQRLQAGLLGLSSNSRGLVAEQSAHNIQLDQPEAAVAAIVGLVEQLRGTAAPSPAAPSPAAP
jgi:pimeloyl-ACP methyl ester carboxylesterase